MARKGEVTRARLLEAARRVFERDGFYDARVTDIADEAGMVPGAIYHYFDSKEAIFRELVRSQEEALVPREEDDALLAATSGIPAIRLSTERYLRRYREHAALFAVIEQVSRHDPEVNAVRLAAIDDLVARAERAIRQLQETGHADQELDAAIAADALTAMASRFAELWLVEGARDYDFDEVVDTLTTLMANALGIAHP